MGAKRIWLIVVTGFSAFWAFAGSYGILGGGVQFAPEILEKIPFPLWVPGVVLGLGVGGSMLVAVIAVIARHSFAGEVAICAGVIMAGWIVVQVALITLNSWMQPATFAFAVATVALGWLVRSERTTTSLRTA